MIDLLKKKIQILIIDDEPPVRNLLSDLLSVKYDCSTASSTEEALLLIQSKQFNLVLSDIEMGGRSGIELIPHVLNSSPDTAVIIISGNQTIESAIEAMRAGAFDYIQKPFNLDHVVIAIERALEYQLLVVEKRRYEYNLEELVKERTERLNYLAYYDALTDLPNRALLEDRLSQSITLAHHNQKILALALLSLDRFKNIQDTLGYKAAVRILREVAERLKKCLGEIETTARFEKDEFALLLTQIQEPESLNKIVNDIEKEFNSPFIIDEHEFFITVSIGISLFPNDGEDIQVLLKNAGAALSRAIEQGGNNHQFYTSDMNAKFVKRLTLENSLRPALEREEFEVFYQPKVDVNSNQIVGMEALLRWQHPVLGFVSPADFISLAEDTGLIVPLGEWVLRTACKQNKLWQDEGFDLNLAVNLSSRQFQQQNLAQTIIGIIKETGLNPCCLNLEVTESSIMKNAESAVKTLNELKEMGIRISIDDFGTGYSSLGYLKSLPIDILKIDKAFVQDITTNPDDASLVRAIVTLAHNLRLKVVAEGVETEEQLKFLHLLRCEEYQGYLFSKPVSAEGFRKLLIEKVSLGKHQ